MITLKPIVNSKKLMILQDKSFLIYVFENMYSQLKWAKLQAFENNDQRTFEQNHWTTSYCIDDKEKSEHSNSGKKCYKRSWVAKDLIQLVLPNINFKRLKNLKQCLKQYLNFILIWLEAVLINLNKPKLKKKEFVWIHYCIIYLKLFNF